MKVAAGDAVILFAHGARDARWSAPLSDLVQAIQARTQCVSVRTAFLELQSPRLQEALEAAASEGARTIHVVPVFWAAAGHVDHELPPIVAEFNRLHPQVSVQTLPVLSELPGMLEFIASAVAATLAPSPSPASGTGERNT